jgi:signal transduction histidine kinase
MTKEKGVPKGINHMGQKATDILIAYDEDAEARDLRHTFIYAGFLVGALAMMIVASDPNILGLNIPVRELLLVTLSALFVSGAGLIALKRNVSVRPLAWVALICYTLIITLTIHYTGGPLTPVPALYILVVVGASFLLRRRGALIISILSSISYAFMLIYEYTHPESMVFIWNMAFDPQNRGPLLIINWLTVTIPTISAALLAGTLAERLKTTAEHLQATAKRLKTTAENLQTTAEHLQTTAERLQATNERLVESEKLRDNLTHMIIHDLRNPITAVMGGLDLLRLMLSDVMNEDQLRLLETSRRSSETLLSLVSDILDINKMEAGKLTLITQPVDVNQILRENAEAVRVLTELEGQNLQLDLSDSLPEVICEERLISRVVSNLLSNAIKHTPDEGTITIASRLYDDDYVAVSVTDTGYGIPVEYREHLFEKFTQAKGEEQRGTGLGLTFCRMTVEAHGGEIWAESEIEQGSTFTFTLPIQGPQVDFEAYPRPQPHAS